MKKVFLLMAMMLPMCINAQIKSDIIDEFLGVRKIVTERVTMVKGMLYTFTIELKRIDQKNYLGCILYMPKCYSMNDDKSLYLKFEDGTLMEAKCNGYAIAEKGLRGWYTDMLYDVNPEDIKKLSIGKVEKFRIYTSEGYVEYPVKEKKAIQLQEQAVALLERLDE